MVLGEIFSVFSFSPLLASLNQIQPQPLTHRIRFSSPTDSLFPPTHPRAFAFTRPTTMSEALSPPSTPVHSYSPGTLVYEVNLSIPREKIDEYVAWLKEFTSVKDLSAHTTSSLGSLAIFHSKSQGHHFSRHWSIIFVSPGRSLVTIFR